MIDIKPIVTEIAEGVRIDYVGFSGIMLHSTFPVTLQDLKEAVLEAERAEKPLSGTGHDAP